MQRQKIAFPTQGLAGFFRVKNELNQYGFFLNWRVTRDTTAREKTPVYLDSATITKCQYVIRWGFHRGRFPEPFGIGHNISQICH